jgi:hypothetical protein
MGPMGYDEATDAFVKRQSLAPGRHQIDRSFRRAQFVLSFEAVEVQPCCST